MAKDKADDGIGSAILFVPMAIGAGIGSLFGGQGAMIWGGLIGLTVLFVVGGVGVALGAHLPRAVPVEYEDEPELT